MRRVVPQIAGCMETAEAWRLLHPDERLGLISRIPYKQGYLEEKEWDDAQRVEKKRVLYSIEDSSSRGGVLMARRKRVSTVEPLLLSVADVAVQLGVCRQTVYSLIYLKEAWRSARYGEAYIVDVQAIRKPHVIGYVTKYRYSRHFFPEKVSDLRARLFAEIELGSTEQAENESSEDGSAVVDTSQPDNGKLLDVGEVPEGENDRLLVEEPPIKRLSWSLVQCEEFTEDIQEYRRRRRKALLETFFLRGSSCELAL